MAEAEWAPRGTVTLQAPGMRAALSDGTEAVLVLRFAGGGGGRALFAFVSAGGVVAHLAVPSRETAEGLLRMCRAFQASNSGWQRVRTFLVEPRLWPRLQPVLSEAFPGAEVRPSAFHPLLHLRGRIRLASLQPPAERLLLSAVSTAAVCAPRPSNLRALRALLSAFLPPPTPSLEDSLLDPQLWATLRDRSWRERLLHLEGLERVALSLGRAFRQGLTLQSSVIAVQAAYESLCLDLPPAGPSTAPSPPYATPGQQQTVLEEEAVQGFRRALQDLCTEPAALLCLGELWALQHSVRLVGAEEDTVHVQILEDTRIVGRGSLGSCSCPFRRDFQLPCRHLLALLNARGKVFRPSGIPFRWRRDCSPTQVALSNTEGLLEIQSGSRDDSLDKYLAVSLLAEQISLLLSRCSHDEFERRYCTLRELADSWIGPYVEVKL